jgi:hypothetical protein
MLSIPDPNFFHSGSQICIKKLSILTQKIVFQALGNMIRVVHPGSGSGFFTHPGSWGKKGTGSLSRIGNTEFKIVTRKEPFY